MPINKNIAKDYFKLWSPNMAYILGFFAADGYMTYNRRGGQYWSIQITDKELLEGIKKVICADHKISVRQSCSTEKTLYRLQIGSKEMCLDLRNLGFTTQKTKNMSVPQVPARFFRDFVRGYFDGDGNVWVGEIHKNRPTRTPYMQSTFTSCSYGFLSEMRRRLRLHGIFGPEISTRKEQYYRLSYNLKGALKLYDFMYNHPVLSSGKDLYLPRKKNTFEKFSKLRP